MAAELVPWELWSGGVFAASKRLWFPFMPPSCALARRDGIRDFFLIALLTLVALAMRLAQVHESLWLDELHTSWVVADAAALIPHRSMIGNQPPTYFYLVWAVVRTLGASELALRLPSVLTGTALVPLSFVLVRNATRSGAAAWTAAFVAAADRDFLFYATEARVYALVQLLAVARFWVFWQALTLSARTWRIAYIVLAAAMFYCHYTTALLWVGEAACVAAWMLRGPENRRDGLRFLADSALILLCCLPAAPHVREIYTRRDNWALFIPRPTPDQLVKPAFIQRSELLSCYLAPTALCLLAAWARRANRVFAPRTVNGASPKEQVGADRPAHWRWSDGPPVHVLAMLLLWIVSPVSAAWLLSVSDVARVFLYRFLIGAAAAVPLLAGLLCGLAPTRFWRGAGAVGTTLVVLFVLSPRYVAQFQSDGRFLADRNEDWRAAVAYLNNREDMLPVLVDAGLIEASDPAALSDPQARQFCLLPVTALYPLDVAHHRLLAVSLRRPEGFTPEARDAITEHHGAWLLLRARPASAARMAKRVRREFSARGACIEETLSFGGVQAVRIGLGQ